MPTPHSPPLSNEEYHAHPAIGASDVKAYLHSPLHYWHHKLNPARVPRAPTPAMLLGTALHCAVLEPDRFEVTYGVGLGLPRRTNADKAAHQAHESQYEQVLSPADYELVVNMRESLRQHPATGPLLAKAEHCEESFFYQCLVSGLDLKCRPDGLVPSEELVLDVKTTADACDRKLLWTVRDFGYDIQAAHYLHCLNYHAMILLMVENTPPHAVRAVRLGSRFLADPKVRHIGALTAIAESTRCHGTTTPWPAYETGVHNL